MVPTPPRTESRPATFGQRVAARLVDGLFLTVLTIAVAVGAIAYWNSRVQQTIRAEGIISDAGGASAAGLLLVLLLGLPIIDVIYFSAGNGRRGGQTLGKRVLGIATICDHRPTVGFWRSVWREIAYSFTSMLLFLGPLAALWHPERRTWHDQLSSTRVVRVTGRPRPVGGLMLATAAMYLLVAMAPLIAVEAGGGFDDDDTSSFASSTGRSPYAASDNFSPAEGSGYSTVEIDCTNTVSASLDDVDQRASSILLLVSLYNTCGADQALDDTDASFTLTHRGSDLLTGSFDFSTTPILIEAEGSATARLRVEHAELSDSALRLIEGTSGAGSYGFRYRFRCTRDVSMAGSGNSELAAESVASGRSLDPTAPSDGQAGSPDGDVVNGEEPTGAPTGDSDEEALAALSRQRDADRPVVERDLVGSWTPQLSAKSFGLEVDGITYDHTDILDDYRSMRARYGAVRLVFSSDYSSFTFPGYWVTLVDAASFPTAEGALAWCAGRGLGRDDCFAKRITNSSGPEENTEYP